MDAGRHPLLRFLTTSCFTEDNPVEPQFTGAIDYFWDMPGNEGDPAVVAALKSIKNVVDLKPFINVNLGQAYYFNYIQLVDHNNPSMGTFKQQVVLTFAGKDAPTILHTHGYALLSPQVNNNHNRVDSIKAPNLLWTLSENGGKDQKFDLNCVQVEYRYHGFSLPEGDSNSFRFLNAEQQSKDLHAIVTDLKQALFTGDGKWLSTGVSKNGLTTAQYAYFDELNGWNDIDLYVPYMAPTTLQTEDIRIGTYMITESSKEALPALEKAYKKLVDDQAVADATIAANAKVYQENGWDPIPANSALLYTIERVLTNLFALQSYGDFDTWTKLIPTENSTPEEYAAFFMLTENDDCIYRKTPRPAVRWHGVKTPGREQPFPIPRIPT